MWACALSTGLSTPSLQPAAVHGDHPEFTAGSVPMSKFILNYTDVILKYILVDEILTTSLVEIYQMSAVGNPIASKLTKSSKLK